MPDLQAYDSEADGMASANPKKDTQMTAMKNT